MFRFSVLVVLCMSFWQPLADAQSREVYTVSGIEVDETADSLIEAQKNAFSKARMIGAQILIERLTLTEDRLAANPEPIMEEQADLLAAAIDVEEEVAGAGRYRGVLAVVFNPRAVRTYLDELDLAYTDVQAPEAVLIAASDLPEQYAWSMAWPSQNGGQLVPLKISSNSDISVGSDWNDLASEVVLYDTRRAILAELSMTDGFYVVQLSSITPGGRREIGKTSLTGTIGQSVQAAQALLEDDWKRISIVGDADLTAAAATIRFTSLAEWNTMRQALAGSPLLSQLRTRAISTDGAYIEFEYAGEGQGLISDLRERGLVLTMQDPAWMIRSAAYE